MLDDSKLQLAYLLDCPNKVIKNMILKDQRRNDLYKDNYNDLITTDQVSLLKNKLSGEVSLTGVLASQDNSFENVFGKLIHWGISSQDILSREINDRYIEYLKRMMT